MADNREILSRSQAGLRFIALMTLFNKQEGARLRQFIADYFTEDALAEQDAESRAQDFEALYARTQKLRVYQVLGIGENQAIVVVEAQADHSYYAHSIQVEKDYPHRVMIYIQQPIETESAD